MFAARAVHAKLFAMLALAVAVLTAALVSHIAIDVAGDFVLAHDTYDGIEHSSRSEIVTLILALLVAGLSRLVASAYALARRSRSAPSLRFAEVFGRGPVRFTVTAIACSVPALMLMEMFDLASFGSRADDLTELLGGSLPLALGITIPVAALVATTVRGLAHIVFGAQRVLCDAIVALIAFIEQGPPGTAATTVAAIDRRVHLRRGIVTRRSRKRGPPLPTI